MMEVEGQQEEEMKLSDLNLTKIGSISESNYKVMERWRKLNYLNISKLKYQNICFQNSNKIGYKLQLRKSKNELNQNMSAEISNNLLSKDNNAFWKSWNQINGGVEPPSSMIDGSMKYNHIAGQNQ